MKWWHVRVGASILTPRCPAGLGPGPHLFRLRAWHTDAKIVLRSNAELVSGVSLETGEGNRLPADGRLCRCVSAPMVTLVIMHASAPQEIDCKRGSSGPGALSALSAQNSPTVLACCLRFLQDTRRKRAAHLRLARTHTMELCASSVGCLSHLSLVT